MNVEQVRELCLSLAGSVEQLYPPPSSISVLRVGEKKFAYFKTSEPEQWRFSIRVSAEHFLELTDQPGIKPARYMGRFHWITIVNVTTVPAEYLQFLILNSYKRALESLPKYRQLEIAKLVSTNV